MGAKPSKSGWRASRWFGGLAIFKSGVRGCRSMRSPLNWRRSARPRQKVALFGLGSEIDALTSAMKERRLLMRDRQSDSRNNITDRPVYGVALGAVALSDFSVKFYSPLVNRQTAISD
jgi:hypothetical protein